MRTQAAVALLASITEGEQQEVEKVVKGLMRLHLVMSEGRLPNLAVRCNSVDIREA